MTRLTITLLAAAATLALLTSCQSLQSSLPTPLTLEEVPELATQGEVLEQYGLPDSIRYDPGGGYTLIYLFSDSKGRGLGLGNMLIGLRWVHLQQGFDRIEFQLDTADQVIDVVVFTQISDLEPQLNPY